MKEDVVNDDIVEWLEERVRTGEIEVEPFRPNAIQLRIMEQIRKAPQRAFFMLKATPCTSTIFTPETLLMWRMLRERI